MFIMSLNFPMSKSSRIISRELKGSPSLVLASFEKPTRLEALKAIKKWLSENPSWRLKLNE